MTKDNNVRAEKTEGSPVSGAFNLIACVLYVAAAALFALHAFLGIRLIPALLEFDGKDLTYAVVFAAGIVFSRLARKSNMLVNGICALSVVVCVASYWYECNALTKNGPMGLRENQLRVGDLVVESLSKTEGLKLIAKVGKYTDVQIDMDSREYENGSRTGNTFKGRVRVELFPRKKESTANNVKYATSPLLVWYDVKVFCSDDEIILDGGEMQDKDHNRLLEAAGLADLDDDDMKGALDELKGSLDELNGSLNELKGALEELGVDTDE